MQGHLIAFLYLLENWTFGQLDWQQSQQEVKRTQDQMQLQLPQSKVQLGPVQILRQQCFCNFCKMNKENKGTCAYFVINQPFGL